MVMTLCNVLNHRPAGPERIQLLGMGQSGRMDAQYIKNIFSRLSAGGVYELMCHPGNFDPLEITDPRLLSYHEWEHEKRLLASPEFEALCDQYHVRLIGYRNLSVAR
jgi:predicted glycoside hydrolase/deacetylase ChbG (UPF0249 family)